MTEIDRYGWTGELVLAHEELGRILITGPNRPWWAEDLSDVQRSKYRLSDRVMLCRSGADGPVCVCRVGVYHVPRWIEPEGVKC